MAGAQGVNVSCSSTQQFKIRIKVMHKVTQQPCLEVIHFMLNSAETKIYLAHKCLNASKCWHQHIVGTLLT